MHKPLTLPFACLTGLVLATAHLGGCSDDEAGTTTGTSTQDGGGGTGATGGSGGTGGTGASGGGGDPQGGGGQGGGGIMNSGVDTCPGDPYTLALGQTHTFVGDTSAGSVAGDYQSYCGNDSPGSGNDLVYAFTLASPATVSYTLTSNSAQYDPVMYARQDCTDPNELFWCRDFSTITRQNKRHVDAGTHYLFVDGNAGTSGGFTLQVAPETPACGDGVTNPTEACDDGNTTDGDGCSADCMTLEPGANDTCSDPFPSAQGLVINAGHTVIPSSSTPHTSIGNAHDYTFDESNCLEGSDQTSIQHTFAAPDRVYHFVPSADGTMTIVLGLNFAGTQAICDIDFSDPGCWDNVLHVRHTLGEIGSAACATDDASDPTPANWVPPTNQIACSIYGTEANGYTKTVTFAVTSGESYYVFVNGYYGPSVYNSGPYWLHIDLN